MSFWMGIAAAQNAAAGTKPAGRGHRVLSIVGGIALARLEYPQYIPNVPVPGLP